MSLLPVFSPTVKATLTYVNAYSDNGGSPYTFPISLGAVASGRRMLFAVDTEGTGSARTVSSMTLHVPDVATDPTGTACSQIVGVSVTSNSAEIWQCTKADGTTGELVVTWSGTCLRSGLGVWNATDVAAVASATTTDTTNPLSQSLTVPNNGFIVAVACGISVTTGWSWGAALTKKFDAAIETGWHSGASNEFVTGGAQTVSATPNVFDQAVMCAAAFGPA